MTRLERGWFVLALCGAALTVACVSRARPVAAAPCASEGASPVTLTGDFHVVYGEGPSYHLIWNGRSSALRFETAGGAAADSLLAFSRRRVAVTGTAVADTATICVTNVTFATEGPR